MIFFFNLHQIFCILKMLWCFGSSVLFLGGLYFSFVVGFFCLDIWGGFFRGFYAFFVLNIFFFYCLLYVFNTPHGFQALWFFTSGGDFFKAQPLTCPWCIKQTFHYSNLCSTHMAKVNCTSKEMESPQAGAKESYFIAKIRPF